MGRPAARRATEQALALVDEELRVTERWGAPGAVGRALRVRGEIARHGDGIEDLRRAVATTDRSLAALEHARSLLALGAALRRANQRAKARVSLNESLQLARLRRNTTGR